MITKNYPKFSVIIPQKNRAEYIEYTLRTCMLQDYPNFDIIISDDCSDDNSVEVISKLAAIDNRIKFFAHKEHLGMHDNFEFALNQVKEGYVIALGGDDGLTPRCIWRMYEIFKETGKELLTWEPSIFVYPEDETKNAVFCVKRNKKIYVKSIKSEDFLNKMAQTFRYLVSENPMFYVKGCASMTIVNRVKSRTKDHSFYYCPTPDGYSGIVLAGEVEEYAFTNEPLSIVGTSPKSQGSNYHRTDEKSRKEANQFFIDNIRRTMHEKLALQPYSPLITLMTADYLLTANDLPGWPGKFKMFTFDHLLRRTFLFIQNSGFSVEVLNRELVILRRIAIQHNLLDLYNDLLSRTKKRVGKPAEIKGFAITKYLRFDGKEIGINNIFDASMATPVVFRGYSLFSFRTLGQLFINTFRFVLGRNKYLIKSLPSVGDIEKLSISE